MSITRLRKWMLLSCIVFSLGCRASVQAVTLHAVVAGNTSCDIGKGIQVDVARIVHFLEIVAYLSDVDLSLRIFDGAEYQPGLIFEHIRGLEVEEDDIVFYYHSSHGFRVAGMEEPWPALSFGSLEAHLRFQDVLEVVQAKPHRLSILLGDCCNSERFGPHGFYHIDYFTILGITPWQQRNCHALFRDFRGTVIACSSASGQRSWSNSSCGGYFTCHFIDAFDQAVTSSEAPSWETILQAAAQNTDKMVNWTDNEGIAVRQCPIYAIHYAE